jgi:formate hydrogenlyase subunit 6/NADH:ubiquinone oxidoreductase subunit I
VLDYGRCIHCQRCVDACPQGCLATTQLDLPRARTRLGLILDLHTDRLLDPGAGS